MSGQLVDLRCPSCDALSATCRMKGNALGVRCTACGRLDVRPILDGDDLDAFGDFPEHESCVVVVLHPELSAGREHETLTPPGELIGALRVTFGLPTP